MSYEFANFLAFVGLGAFAIFGIIGYLSDDGKWSFVSLIGLIVFVIGACSALSMAESYSVNVAREHIASELNVPFEQVDVAEPQCVASVKYSCITWQARFKAGEYGGMVIFDDDSATIEKLWKGDLSPIEGMLFVITNYLQLIKVLLFAAALTVGALTHAGRYRRHHAKKNFV